jgi:hypothetical protein
MLIIEAIIKLIIVAIIALGAWDGIMNGDHTSRYLGGLLLVLIPFVLN